MKLKYTLIFGLLFLISCSEPYVDNDIRVAVVGKVQDINGNPIEDATVHVYLQGNSSSLLSGTGLSGADGTFRILSIFGRNDNLRVDVSKDNSYSNHVYLVGIRDYIPTDLTFDVQNIQLSKVAFLDINVNREANSENTFNLSVEYTSPDCIQYFDGLSLIENFSFCFGQNTFSATLGDAFPNFSRTIVVPLNSDVSITYNVNDSEPVTETIQVNQENQIYEIVY